MARKALSAQVIEEVDRATGLLRPVQDIVDPMTSHMVGAVLESLRRIETMCIAARQAAVNTALADPPTPTRSRASKAAPAAPATPRASHRAPAGRKRGE